MFIPNHTLQAICQTLRDERVVDFVRSAIRVGYHEVLSAPGEQIDRLVDTAFDKLAHSQQKAIDLQKLAEVAAHLLEHTFRKGDEAFWFNQSYHHYKTRVKPEIDFQQLNGLIKGKRVLDYGCGSGYLAARLAGAGYTVLTTDVLDYRYAEAKHLPFIQMASATDIPYPNDSADTALVQAVLHHIDLSQLPIVLQRLAQITQRALIKEDTYDLPDQLLEAADTLTTQPLLRAFISMPSPMQYEALVLIDFFGNAIAQGIPEMNMPFAFRSVKEWGDVLEAHGLRITQTLLAGFEPGRLHKSCHVWFVCDRIG